MLITGTFITITFMGPTETLKKGKAVALVATKAMAATVMSPKSTSKYVLYVVKIESVYYVGILAPR